MSPTIQQDRPLEEASGEDADGERNATAGEDSLECLQDAAGHGLAHGFRLKKGRAVEPRG